MKQFLLLFFMVLSGVCFAAKLPELPKELLNNSNVKQAPQKAKTSVKKNNNEPIPDQYLSCTATRQSDLVGLPNRTLTVQVSKNSVQWIEARKTYSLRVEEYEYLVGDSKEGFVINRRDGQVDYLEEGKILHGVCKPTSKPDVAV